MAKQNQKASADATWIELQKQSQEEIDMEALSLENENNRNKTNNDIHLAKTLVTEKKKALDAVIRSKSYSVVAELAAERELAVAEKNVEDLLRIKKKRFSAESED